MLSRFVYMLFILCLPAFLTSCRVKRKEYIERHGLHSDKKPKEIAKEIGELSKKQKRAYKKEQRQLKRATKKKARRWAKGKKTYAE